MKRQISLRLLKSSNLKLSLLLGLFLSACAVVPPSASYQMDYFPDGVENTYLGMPFRYLEKTHKGLGLQKISDSTDLVRNIYSEKFSAKDYSEAIYYFDKDLDEPLYLVKFLYPSGVDPFQIAVDKYGEPNSEEGEWVWHTPEKFLITVWTEADKIVVSGKIKGTTAENFR